MARPTQYKKEFADQVKVICNLGGTDKDIAQLFGVSEKTVNNWKKQHPEFLQSLKKGKDHFDSKIETALAERAIGYKHPEEKIFFKGDEVIKVEITKHHPPDVTACIYWLNNRRSKEWASRKAVESQIEVKTKSNNVGLLVVPDVVSVDDWEKMGAESLERIQKANQ